MTEPRRRCYADRKVHDYWHFVHMPLAEQFAYSGPIGEGVGPFALTNAYQADADRVAQQQVALAGARLARLLCAALH